MRLTRLQIRLVVVAFALAGASLAHGQRLAFLSTLASAHAPKDPFTAATAPVAPDYSDRASWGALPDKSNPTDVTPPGVLPVARSQAAVDVFFIHPTTFYSNSKWNQPLDDAETNKRTDDGPLRAQASVFNGCCRIFAPRYRQMTFSGFLAPSVSSHRALDLAYDDVKRAFEYYIAHYNNGRPFIIASHSQGSRLAVRLLPDEIDATPLRRQFVAAYIVGNWITEDWFSGLKTIKPCEAASETGCVLTWSTVAEGSDAQAQRLAFARRSGAPPGLADKPFVCTNPLTWTRSHTPASKVDNLGGWVPGRGTELLAIVPGIVSARCDDGALLISEPADSAFRVGELPGGNYHNYDYQLFYMNIRKNAELRAESFVRSH